MEIRRIGILTGGGDAPGLNAVIRAVVKAAYGIGAECLGIPDGFDGLLAPGRAQPLGLRDVAGIHRLGGTILGTTNLGSPLAAAAEPSARECLARSLENARALDLGALIVAGGDGTLAIALQFFRAGLPVVGIPKTIDSDLAGTELTIGFDSAVSFATDAIDRLHTTADAHHRVMVAEVMGRYAGWIAIHAGLAGGADVVLIPEIPFDLTRVASHIARRQAAGARCTVVVAAEGAMPIGGTTTVAAAGVGGRPERLGGVAQRVAGDLERLTGRDVRFDVLGHLQRGGAPSACDRVAATRFGAYAVDVARRGEFGVMVAWRPPDLVTVPLESVVGRAHAVPTTSNLVTTARSIGICFGD